MQLLHESPSPRHATGANTAGTRAATSAVAAPTRDDDPVISSARQQLAPLLRQAAIVDLDDEAGMRSMRAAAGRVTSHLARAAVLPDHLVVGDQDSPALVVRLLGVAWRHLVPLSPGSRPSP